MFCCINLCFLCSVRIFISQVTGGLSVVVLYYNIVASVLHRLCCIHLFFYINQVLLSLQALSEQVLAHGNQTCPIFTEKNIAWSRQLVEAIPKGRYSFLKYVLNLQSPMSIFHIIRTPYISVLWNLNISFFLSKNQQKQMPLKDIKCNYLPDVLWDLSHPSRFIHAYKRQTLHISDSLTH